jgi:hypothetical protein
MMADDGKQQQQHWWRPFSCQPGVYVGLCPY